MKKRCFIYFFTFFLIACQNYKKEVNNEELLLSEELKKIDWTKVDDYPSINNCDSLLTEEARTKCFFEFISAYVQEQLQLDTLVGKIPKIDTLNILVSIFPNSEVTLELYNIPDSLKFESAKIDSLLRIKSFHLPEIEPGIKRGIPVKTQFVLPIVFQSN